MTKNKRTLTGDQALVRRINLSLILNKVFEKPSLSRAELAELTGLTRSTVSSLVQELLEYRLLHETGLAAGSVGRPSMQLELNPQAGFMVGCEVGVDFISVIVTDFRAQVIWQHRETTPAGTSQQAILARILALLDQAVANGGTECDTPCGLLGIAVGVPGLVDHASGKLLFAPNLEWRDVPLLDILNRQFPSTLIFVENEANVAALGEYFFGAAKGYEEVLYISAGIGLGGAVVRNGQLVKGKAGFAGEFGHMTIEPDGLPCKCGNQGCWETLATQAAVFRCIQAELRNGRQSKLPKTVLDDAQTLTVPLVVDAARASDPVARQALTEVGRYLGIGIASLVNALNPDLVVLGGILSEADEFVLPVIEEELTRRALPWNAEATRVVIAHHGSDACVMGGVAIVFQSTIDFAPGATLP
jgi:glucokinase-like ROK family protein